jgi:two-component system response regulator CpxR
MEPKAERSAAGPSILIIDDDTELCALMNDFLTSHGLVIEAVHDGRLGLARALEGNFDLVILDVMLPLLNGFELLRTIRKRSEVPIIMLTARTAEQDRVLGLNSGADDYLPKPFGADELLARVRAVLRRTNRVDVVGSERVSAGGVELNPQTREAWFQGEPVDLTSIQFDILEFLVRSAGRTVSRDELATVLYQRPSTPYERSMDVHISHLRRKLNDVGGVLIHTIRGVGYLFAPR